jgi:ankyrin repeat protein
MMTTITKYQANNALCEASKTGDIVAAQKSIEDGASTNGRVEYGKTPLMFAIQNAQVGMITFLKTRGARLNMLDEDQEHPMIYAFTNGTHDENGQEITTERTMEVLRTLIALGVDRDARGEFGTPAFHYASAQLEGNQLVELAKLKLKIGGIDPFGDSNALHALARNKRIAPPQADLLVAMVEACGIDINRKNSDGHTPLFIATRRENEVFASALLGAGAKPLTKAMTQEIDNLLKQDQLDAQERAQALQSSKAAPRP